MSGGYDFIRSTYQQAVEKPKFDKGAQLAYTPEHRWFGRFLVKWQSVSVAYQHRHTGKVGTLNFTELPSYHLGEFQLNYDWKMKLLNVRFFFRLENVWGADYQVIEFRAMPGRHVRAGIKMEFLTNKN